MKLSKPKFFEIFTDNPLILVALAVPVVIILILVFVSGKKTPTTAGDIPSPESNAFLVYQDRAYFPTKNVISDTIIRKDVAYFARQTIKDYDPKKNPGVIFNISKVTDELKSKSQIDLDGKFEKSNDAIHITIKLIANDRVEMSVINKKSNTNINDQLPSTGKENSFIASLPITSLTYTIDYISSDGSVVVTIYEKNPTYIEQANEYIKSKVGPELFSGLKVSYIYPTNTDYGETLNDISEQDPSWHD